MPISDEALSEPWNRYLAIWEEATLRRVVAHLQAPGSEVQEWWAVVVRYRDGGWGGAVVAELLRRAREEPELLDRAVGELPGVHPTEARDRETASLGEALRWSRRFPGRPLVVIDGDRLVGILLEPQRSSGDPVGRVEVGPAEPLDDLLVGPGDGPAPAEEEEERFTDVSCPDRVWTGAPRFTVTFQLTVEPVHQGRAVQRTWVRPGAVLVELQAPGCELLGPARQELTLRPGEDSDLAVYHLRPGPPGVRHLSLEMFQGSRPLGVVSVEVEVTAEPAGGGTARAPSRRLPRDGGAAAPHRVLRVIRDRQARALRFTLVESDRTGWNEFEPIPLEVEPDRFAAGLFAGVALEDPATLAGLAPEDLDRRLKALGHDLWRRLVPPRLQELYAEEREGWRDRSLLVLSDEPHVPWEMVWPYGDRWEDDGPWCLTTRFSRWLRRDGRQRGNDGAPGLLPVRRLAGVVPGDSGLPDARVEGDFLRELCRRHGLEDVSPRPPRWSPVMARLEDGGYDWLHAAAHGRFLPGRPVAPGELHLEGGEALSPGHLAGPRVEAHLRHHRPGFVFNACETGSQGWGLTGLAGWAERLVSCGAGLFLAPLWAVEDRLAFTFVHELYHRLLAGDEAAQACRRARLAARAAAPGDPTWLAYSLYAHPHARLGR